ncbi:ABC transporter permease [Williamsia deligens]|uniref:ABC transporter permease n=1 Tax=Williamsia deligens TaxID=321325 RepID=A0ABW3GC54_9NOCA|nr:ABC transporter permease [Williamsia deligens]MCP2192941.1 peptide/nickel transport system permease protein [Williamsia deligens]
MSAAPVIQGWAVPRVRRIPVGLALAGAFLAAVIVAAVVPSVFATGDPLRIDLAQMHAHPSLAHPFGCDQLGRDVWTRVVHGTRQSVAIGAAATALAVAIGVPLGLLAGIGNRVTETLLSRFFDLMGAFPEILLALVLIAVTGSGTGNVVLAIGIAAAPRFARVMRADTRLVARADHVVAARLLTRSRVRIVLRHVLPNAIGALPVLVTLGLGTSILGAAALSFLGFGTQPPTPEWGSMLAESRDDLRIAWWAVFFPGVAVTATVVATTVVGRAAQRRFENRVTA